MEQIQRVGSPRALEAKGSVYKVLIQLDSSPSQNWLNAFKVAPPATPSLQPSAVSIERDQIFFHSDEQTMGEWVKSIQGWIAAANAILVEEERTMEAWRTAQETERQDSERRLDLVNEKLKDL
jgi:hypothetical protein